MNEMRNIVVVGGCGHVGLPFGMVLADHGMQVILLDVDGPKVAAINQGKMPFREAWSFPSLAHPWMSTSTPW